MWKSTWPIPPQNSDELYLWKIYCRIWSDVGLASPGTWIYQWLRMNLNISGEKSTYAASEAVRWYVFECRE